MVAKRSRKARAGAEPAGFDSSTFLHFHARVADGEANGLQSRDSRFESVPWCHRRARQMVSQHTANVPSVHARLGSIPRLSAKLVSKKVRVSGGYGRPRLPVKQSAPLERPGSNPGIALTVAFSLVGVVLFGAVVGSMLPFILGALGVDPAS